MDEIKRPPIGDPFARFWVIGTFAAASGKKYEDCPFREDLLSGRLWHAGYQAYVEEKKYLKTKESGRK